MNKLEEIVNNRREKLFFPDNYLEGRQGFHTRKPKNFRKALILDQRPAFITEVKKGSPSAGVIREDFDHKEIAKDYIDHGADCLSVLTERDYFLGHDKYLSDIAAFSPIPILRKDFLFDKRQIRESYELGADAILVIVACLSKEQVQEFLGLAHEFDLAAITEIHDEKELGIALECGADIIGVNNRNLKTLETDLSVSERIIPLIPAETPKISESGIKTSNDIQYVEKCGADAVLIGERLMKFPSPGQALSKLKTGSRH